MKIEYYFEKYFLSALGQFLFYLIPIYTFMWWFSCLFIGKLNLYSFIVSFKLRCDRTLYYLFTLTCLIQFSAISYRKYLQEILYYFLTPITQRILV